MKKNLFDSGIDLLYVCLAILENLCRKIKLFFPWNRTLRNRKFRKPINRKDYFLFLFFWHPVHIYWQLLLYIKSFLFEIKNSSSKLIAWLMSFCWCQVGCTCCTVTVHTAEVQHWWGSVSSASSDGAPGAHRDHGE